MLFCDADGCLFPSEEPAFDASTGVTNALLAELGIEQQFAAAELRASALGKSFRATALDLAIEHGRELPAATLERWVEREQREVTAHLAAVLEPDPAVRAPLERLAARFRLAVVSSSAMARLAACFAATGLDDLFPVASRYSAEDSLAAPASKPDPAIYAFAARDLGVEPHEALAVEDSVPGVRSAVGAGVPVAGHVQFVPADERAERAAALRDAGAAVVVEDWAELERRLAPDLTPPVRAPLGR